MMFLFLCTFGMIRLIIYFVENITVINLKILKVGAQTETELKEKKLRVEDALNATKVS